MARFAVTRCPGAEGECLEVDLQVLQLVLHSNELRHRTCGGARPDLRIGNVLRHYGTQPDRGVVSDPNGVPQGCRWGNPGAIAENGAPTDHCVGDHEGVLAHDDVVRDVDEVVDLGAPAHDGVAQT